MSNTLTTALVSPLTKMVADALRQSAGLTQSVTIDPNPQDLGYGQSKTLPRVGSLTVGTFTPSVNAPTAVDVTTGGNTLSMSNRKHVLFHLTGEEAAGLKYNADSFVMQHAQEAVDEAVQDVESAIRTALNTGAGYAVKTGGTNPFDSTGKIDVLADARTTLTNAGVPVMDRSAILGPNGSGRYLNLDINTKTNERGDIDLRREGTLGRDMGFAMRETPSSGSFTKSSAASYTNDGAISVGDTTFTAQSGSNSFKAGDILSFSGASYKYVVSSYDASSGVVTLNAPFLEAISDATNITVETSDNRDFVVGRKAAMLSIRPDTLAEAELRTQDTTIITDPVSGVSMRLSRIPGVGLTQFQLSWVYGVAMWVEEAAVIIPGN